MKKTAIAGVLLIMLMGINYKSHAIVADMKSTIEAWLNHEFGEKNVRWEAELVSDACMQKNEQYHVLGLRGVKKPKNIMVFVIEKQCVHIKKTIEVIAKVKKLIKVPICTNVIHKGITIKNSDWVWEERAGDSISRDNIADEKDLMNRRTKKVLAKNEVIFAHDLEKIPDILSGQKVTLQVCGAGIVIKTDATSLEDGNVQDSIKVRQENSGQVVQGWVAEPGLVQISLYSRR